jgi:hypothetical protein
MNKLFKYRTEEWYQKKLEKIKRNQKIMLTTNQELGIEDLTGKKIDHPKDILKPVDQKKMQKKSWNKYKVIVWKITRGQDLASLENYEKRITIEMIKEHGRKLFQSEDLYTLDHRISIYHGWKNDLNPYVIGGLANLRYIPSRQNCIKGTKCE